MTRLPSQRCTFAIISHPDAGKTTLTEKLLLKAGAIQFAGSIKAKRSGRHTVSDWMELEKKRGISVSTSVMQFPFGDRIMNLLDTPGHADFSEDTYRTLTAVDSALMVIDAAKGVEERTRQLMEVCRMRDTPVMTFVNKLDRDARPALELLDDIEKHLGMICVPMTWPMGMGRDFQGIYHLQRREMIFYRHAGARWQGFETPPPEELLPSFYYEQLKSDLSLIEALCPSFDEQAYLEGRQTPVFFGSAMNEFGIDALLEGFAAYAPGPQAREARERTVTPSEQPLTGFVFKIQANMDPQHHDRVAFVRLCSGTYRQGMRIYHVREKRHMALHHALTFMAGEREHAEEAQCGDVIGMHSHGSIRMGDTFTEGETLHFLGIPSFAPTLFRVVRLQDPLKMKALNKGLEQLSEEGAVQMFRPLLGSDIILGAVGILQFDVVASRLEHEYKVGCRYDSAPVALIRWVDADDATVLNDFKKQHEHLLAQDIWGALVYLAPSSVNMQLTEQRWPKLRFTKLREHGG